MPRFSEVNIDIDAMHEENRRNYEERRQKLMKLEKENKERSAESRAAKQGTPDEQIARRIEALKTDVSAIQPGDVRAMTKVLYALRETVRIVEYLFQKDAKGGNTNHETAEETRESPGEQANAEGNSG